ncbi:MAG: glycosyltransferase family 2 protein [Gammaproteobacteria bacterium]|nr:glycosyltransferase family 2 protein [Gammaproteobacteria bacterium]
MELNSLDGKLLSIVIPLYNETEVLPSFIGRLVPVLEKLPVMCELVFVNDGSSDDTMSQLLELQKADQRISIIDLSRNFGKEIALSAGLDHAKGDAAVVIDADLQDPPELIVQLVAKWQEGFDVVYAERTTRHGESYLKRVTAHLFYRLMQNTGSVRIPPDTGDYRLLSRRAINALGQLREQHRFMKGLFTWIGYRQVSVPFEREPRANGKSKWSYWRLWNFALEGITSFTTMPLRVATYTGFLTAFLAFLYGLIIVTKTLVYGDAVPGYPSLMVVILFLGGAQLMAIGVIGEYLGRMFDESKQRPLYLVQRYLPAAQSDNKQAGEHGTTIS